MKIKIDLKILIFLALFYLTNQIKNYLIIMFFCMIHECGHIIMGLILKMKPEKLEIIPCGISVSFKEKTDDSNLNLKKIFVALAGPFISMGLAILYTKIEPIYISKQVAIYANILVLLFNLVPIYPLDGGRIVKGILYMRVGAIKSEKVTNKISNITMICITIISSIAVYYFKNIAIFLICIFLWVITIRENNKFRMEKNSKTLAIFQGK